MTDGGEDNGEADQPGPGAPPQMATEEQVAAVIGIAEGIQHPPAVPPGQPAVSPGQPAVPDAKDPHLVELQALDLELQATRLRGEKEDLDFRKEYAHDFKVAIFAQVIIVDAIFFIYAIYTMGKGEIIPTAAISAWVGATVVQVIGVVMVITRNLFPNRDRPPTLPDK